MKKTSAIALALLVSTAACSQDVTDELEDAASTAGDVVTTLEGVDDVASLAQDVQLASTEVIAQIEQSEAAETLQEAWGDLGDQVTMMVNNPAEIDRAAVEAQLESFQGQLDGLGEEAGPELVSAWNEFRTLLEDLLDQI